MKPIRTGHSHEYIEYTINGATWIDIDTHHGIVRFKPAHTEPHCPRCTSTGIVIINHTGHCPECRHTWDQPQQPAAPGVVTQINIQTGQTP